MERYCEQEKNCLRVYVPRELDHHEADRLKQEADFFIETGQVKTLVFDFAGTEFMDSSGIGILLNRYKEMKASGGKTCLYGAGPQVLRVLKIAGIPALMEMYDSEEAAFGCQGVEKP